MRNIIIINIKRKKKEMHYNHEIESFKESLFKFIDQTITVFTTSGGEAGEGFTGVLLDVNIDHINLLTELGSPPIIPSSNKQLDQEEFNVSLGSITNIPIDKITAFVHNVI